MKKYKNDTLYQYLTENYSTKSKEDILNDLGLSWNYIQKKCCIFGIKRKFNKSSKSHQLSKILELKNIDCYWLGFLLADGHLSKRYSLDINLSIKDKNQIYKFIEYYNLSTNTYIYDNQIRVSISDKPTIMKLSKMFHWGTNKTKNPVTIPNISKEQFFSLIIGFIDGDGTITKEGDGLIIKCHKSWENILDSFYLMLNKKKGKFNKIDNCYYIGIYKQEKLREIKNKAIELNLPILKRKWDRINLSKILKQEKRDIVINLIKENKSKKEIKKITNFSDSFIYKILKNQKH